MAISSGDLIRRLQLDVDQAKKQIEKSSTGEAVVDGAIVVSFPGSNIPRRVSFKDANPVEALSNMQIEGGIPVGYAYYVATADQVRTDYQVFEKHAHDDGAKHLLEESRKDLLREGEVQRHFLRINEGKEK